MPEGERPSELDRLRRPPFAPTITGLVQALERLCDVRALGVGGLDLSALPPRRVAALARYAEDAWATQLADLALRRPRSRRLPPPAHPTQKRHHSESS